MFFTPFLFLMYNCIYTLQFVALGMICFNCYLQGNYKLLLYQIGGLTIFLAGNRYWVTEMHVDGFRFDLASIMTRGSRL